MALVVEHGIYFPEQGSKPPGSLGWEHGVLPNHWTTREVHVVFTTTGVKQTSVTQEW